MESVSIKESMNVIAEVELVYRNPIPVAERPKITSSGSAYDRLLDNWDAGRIQYLEQFKILLLNRSNHVLGIYELSSGGISGTVVDPKLVFTAALKASAVGIILAHNHPSGNLQPSLADERITRKLTEAGRLLDIEILDHLIITPDGYFSFRDQGLL
ncbi:JAB domain-containing protein [Niabella hirudinis]|uniref:JAB domain-containing protein n=1 Tax=Niabella hirudinis TaxID=1285929 RepID=UPI003EBACF6A